MSSNPRDEAVDILALLLKRVFARLHLPWTKTMERAVPYLIDRIVAAAVDQMRDELDMRDETTFDDELAALLPRQRRQERPTQPLEPRPYNDRPQDIYDARTLLQRQNGAEQ